MNRFEVASIYVRQKNIVGVRWFDGPYPLPDAHRVMLESAELELNRVCASGHDVMYYELRGLEGCSVRYRLWVERPVDYLRTEVITVCAPGGHVQGVTRCGLGRVAKK